MLSRQLHPAMCKSRLVPHCLPGASHSVLVAVSTLNHNQTRHRQRRASCCASSEDVAPLPQQRLSETEKDSVLQQLEQLRRQLDDAVEQEDYSKAQQLKQQADALKQQLSPVQQYVQAQLGKLRSGSPAEKAEALKGLGEAGTFECLADLAALLSDSELGEAASATMWRIFIRNPNTEVQRLMEHGIGFMEKGNYPLALEAFEAAATLEPSFAEVIKVPYRDFSHALNPLQQRQKHEGDLLVCIEGEGWGGGCRVISPGVYEAAATLEPSFAEAHNKRATVLYLMEKYQQSIEMCELVLELNPYHFAAASGMGMCYLKLADYTGALQAFERSLRINPGLTHIQEYIKALRKQLPASETPEQ